MKEIEITGSDLDELNEIIQKIWEVEIPKKEEKKNEIFFGIGKARRKKGWTYAELSEKSGVEEKTIMEMEAMIAKPQLMDVIKVCNALDLHLLLM